MTSRTSKRTAAIVSAVLLVLTWCTVGASAAVAAVPPTPVASPFAADRCAGTTTDDPADAGAPVPDLTQVFGQRLTDYNAGKVVVLYGSYGDNSLDSYPPVCGVQYVAGVGAVSQWMFCTDIFSHVCSGTNANGELLDIDGVVIPGLEARTGNSKLDADQEKVISYLIQNGHDYDGLGTSSYSFNGVTHGVADETSDQRSALQTLIWCISDPVNPAAVGSEAERRAVCAANMDSTEQARILAMIPDAPAVHVSLDSSSTSLKVGDTATFVLTTNLYGQPITVTTSGLAGTLSVQGGGAALAGNELTVTGTDPTVSTAITLAFTPTADGTVGISASATPVSTDDLRWNQSPGVSADNVACQVYSHFEKTSTTSVNATASAVFAVKVTVTPSPTPSISSTPTSSTSASGTPSGSATSTASSTPTPSASTTRPQTEALSETGVSVVPGLVSAAVLLMLGTTIVVVAQLRRRATRRA